MIKRPFILSVSILSRLSQRHAALLFGILVLLVPLSARGQAKKSTSQTDSEIVADFERKVETVTDLLRKKVWSTQYAEDHHHVPYRGKWQKQWCVLDDVGFDIQKTESLVSPLIAIATWKVDHRRAAPFDPKARLIRPHSYPNLDLGSLRCGLPTRARTTDGS